MARHKRTSDEASSHAQKRRVKARPWSREDFYGDENREHGRFDDLTRALLSVPKEELDQKREEREKGKGREA